MLAACFFFGPDQCSIVLVGFLFSLSISPQLLRRRFQFPLIPAFCAQALLSSSIPGVYLHVNFPQLNKGALIALSGEFDFVLAQAFPLCVALFCQTSSPTFKANLIRISVLTGVKPRKVFCNTA